MDINPQLIIEIEQILNRSQLDELKEIFEEKFGISQFEMRIYDAIDYYNNSNFAQEETEKFLKIKSDEYRTDSLLK